MRIVIAGATGRTGRRLLAQALERGHEVTAFVRTPAKLPGRLYRPHGGGSVSPLLRVVAGHVRDRGALAEAVEGAEAVVTAFGGRVRKEGRVRTEGAAALVGAMKAAGVRRLVALSAYGAGESRNGGPYARWIRRLIPAEYEDTEGMERIVRRSGLAWVLVRPTLLMNRRLTRRYRAAEDLEVGWFPRIARGDVAHFMLGEVTGDRWTGRAPGLTGSRDRTPSGGA